jgi:hypothetical protein
MENLEEKVDWKQWLPIVGPYFIAKDLIRGEPTVIDLSGSDMSFYVSCFYHGVVSFYPTYLGVMDLLNNGI